MLQNGEQFQTDETNFVPDTARNLLRLKIIPEIQNGINSSCEKVICRNAKLLNEDEKYLNGVAKEAYLNAKTENGVDAEKLIHLPMPIKSRAVMHMLRENGVQNDVFQPHIEALTKLLEMQSGAKIEMSTVIIRKASEGCSLKTKAARNTSVKLILFPTQKKTDRPAIGCSIVPADPQHSPAPQRKMD